MKFVFPNMEYKDRAIDFIHEFYEHRSEINGSGGLDRFLEQSTYEKWVEKVKADIDIANITPDRVPALTYFFVREEDEKIVGMINIRLALNDFLKEEGGHIGYCVRPTERKKRYATEMLSSVLQFCKTIGLSKVLVTCKQRNIASAGVIRNCGGLLDAEFYSETFKY